MFGWVRAPWPRRHAGLRRATPTTGLGRVRAHAGQGWSPAPARPLLNLLRPSPRAPQKAALEPDGWLAARGNNKRGPIGIAACRPVGDFIPPDWCKQGRELASNLPGGREGRVPRSRGVLE